MAKRTLEVVITGDGKAVAKTVHIDSVRTVVTQTGAINAALILCPRECHKNHIARCPVCTHLELAKREIR